MGQKLFSETLQPFTGDISNVELTESISSLRKFLGAKKLKLFQWNERAIALAAIVPVELPPLGNFENLDIIEREPVLIVVYLNDYPNIAPAVFPDRLDFPKNNLAHLYVAAKGKPPAFCLVKGGLGEWYGNKRLSDLYVRVSNWLRDAAAGVLTEDGNRFDPIRIEGYCGSIIYDYDNLANVVNKRFSYNTKENFAIAFFERNTSGDRISFKLVNFLTADNILASVETLETERKKADSSPLKKSYHFGYIIWSEQDTYFTEYAVDFPEDWNGFKRFCFKFGIDTIHLERHIAEKDHNDFVHIPVIVAVRRPKVLIGFSDNIEFFNFTIRVDSNDVKEGCIINNVLVLFYTHAQPLSRQKAKEISGEQVNLGRYALIAGCGALGSKVVMHFARSGVTNYFLTDPDDVSPHNLVRHALLGSSEGLNKADALAKEIKGIYPYEKVSLLLSAKSNGSNFFGVETNKIIDWVLDFTASNAFSQSLVKTQLHETTRVAQAFMTDFGKMGMIFFEGQRRNPRIDDLRVMLYAQYRREPFISEWLQREAKNSSQANNLSITIGVGCNSETTVLADDLVSLHAASTSAIIKRESQQPQPEEGRVYVNVLQDEPFFGNIPHMFKIPPLEILTAINNPSWQIRIMPGILVELKKDMGLAMPKETGGVFVGCANHKTKVVHVTHFIKAPADSLANEVCFFRGIRGLPGAIKEVNEGTGNQLGYIGEWHTHPFGPNQMSATDAAAIKKFKKEFSELLSPIPVFMMIITPTHILPYVY